MPAIFQYGEYWIGTVNPGRGALSEKCVSAVGYAVLVATRSLRALTVSRGVLGVFALAGILSAQADRFEVASIRPSGAAGGRPAMEFTPGGGVRAVNVTLKLLIQMAYDIRSEQLFGGAPWTDSEQYTVIASASEGGHVQSPVAQTELVHKRLQALLRERFQLALKHESQQAAGYVLTLEKKGHKMAVATDPTAPSLRQIGRWEINAEGVPISTFARFLGVHLRGTVIDQTGLDGRYTFHLNWKPDVPAPSALDPSARELPEESLVPAVQEQLGLRLERQKVTTDRYTIERAQKPTEN
jgi:uncharacterized protein (TIGR03435 family)